MKIADSMDACQLCPRLCGVNRRAGRRGWCQAGPLTEIFRYAPHSGEEPPLSGQQGSGTIFFSRCTLKCGYCQNFPWSQEGQGSPYDVEGVRNVLRELRRTGCHNWNLVSPTPWLPSILEPLESEKQAGRGLPVVYNTSGFEREETLEAIDPWVDVYLPDLRYANPQTAREASQADRYVEVARRALVHMWAAKGPLQVDARGVAVRGTICRVLVLPGHAHEAIASLRWMADTIGVEVSLSLMAQYRPAWKAARGAMGPDWQRTLRTNEYDAVCKEVDRLGFDRGWIQELEHEAAAELLGWRMPASGENETLP